MDMRIAAGVAPASGVAGDDPSIALERRYAARNYDPLPVVLTHGEGSWLWDEHGRRYLDMMSAYSAVSCGHAHPRIVATLIEQAQRLAVTSRAFHNESCRACSSALRALTGLDRALPSNGGAEAVETALKAARKWGYKVKGIPADRPRSSSAAAISTAARSRSSAFRPSRSIATASARSRPDSAPIPFGDADALARAIGPQHRGVPRRADPGRGRDHRAARRAISRSARASAASATCSSSATRSRPGWDAPASSWRASTTDVKPDGVILGKALGGGLLPVSAFVGDRRRDAACSRPAITAARSAAIRWRRRWRSRRST